MKLICRLCEGEGRIISRTGHTEICPECMGLGYREVNEDDRSLAFFKERKVLMNAVYILMIVMAIFYVSYLIAVYFYSLSFSTGLIILLAGHLAGVGGFFVYILSGILRGKEGF